MEVKVWVCPTDGCGNYYGSSSQAHLDLTNEINHESSMLHSKDSSPANPRVVGNRGICPDCRSRGQEVQRERVTVDVMTHGRKPALRAV
jgi:hypothetical protein